MWPTVTGYFLVIWAHINILFLLNGDGKVTFKDRVNSILETTIMQGTRLMLWTLALVC